MKYLRIIPSLLLFKKKLVKGVKFSNHKIAGNPSTTILSLENQGADEIILLDIEAYRNNNYNIDYDFLKSITQETTTPITYGGGVDTVKKGLDVIKSGFEKVYLNRILLKKPRIIKELSENIGSQAIVAGVNLTKEGSKYKIFEDVDNKYDLFDYINLIQELGAGEIKITFVDLEGTCAGLDISFIQKLLKIINISNIFEGGIGDLKHLKNAFENKIDAVALGTLIIFKDYNIVKIKKYLDNEGFRIRI